MPSRLNEYAAWSRERPTGEGKKRKKVDLFLGGYFFSRGGQSWLHCRSCKHIGNVS